MDHGELINPKEGFEQHLVNTPCESENESVYRSGNPYQTILDAEQEFVPEMIVMASHSHTMAGRLIMGSNTDYMLHHAHCRMYILKNYELDNH